MRGERLYTIVACALLALSLGPLAISALILGFLHGESPCVLCWAQRTGMTLIALTAVLILRFGPRPRYIGFGVLLATHGLYMAIRHSALHLSRDVGQGFAIEILGAHTYIWSGVIFFLSLVLMGALLLLMRDGEALGAVRDPGTLGRASITVFLIAVAGNAVQAFASTGPPPFVGQGDPIRFSWNPQRWVWSLEEWKSAPISWRGRWDIEKPTLAGLDRAGKNGPIAAPPVLAPLRELRVGVELGGALSDLAYDAASDRFALTTIDHGLYVLDNSLSRVLRHAVLDPGYSVELGPLSGVTFAGDTILAMGTHKSWSSLHARDGADPDAGYRSFLRGADQFEERSRGRLATVRARLNYVMSLAYDPGSDSFYTLTVPNRRHKRLVVSRFDRADMTLAGEYVLRVSPSSGVALAGDGRSLDEYYVTGAAIDGGKLFAVSAAYSTLLTVDLETRLLAAAHVIEGLDAPTGIAVKGDELWIGGADGRIVVVRKP
jgi:disulfide bond formation protein DsbB